MGSGTDLSSCGCGRRQRRCGGRTTSPTTFTEDYQLPMRRSVEDVASNFSSQRATHEQERRFECSPQDTEEIISSSRLIPRPRTGTTSAGGLLMLIATILLITLQCDMVTRRLLVAASSSPATLSASGRLASATPMEEERVARNSPVQHISEIYRANNVLRSAPADEKKEESLFSDSDLERIQDLVLRGLNITRIPRAAEVSKHFDCNRGNNEPVINWKKFKENGNRWKMIALLLRFKGISQIASIEGRNATAVD